MRPKPDSKSKATEQDSLRHLVLQENLRSGAQLGKTMLGMLVAFQKWFVASVFVLIENPQRTSQLSDHRSNEPDKLFSSHRHHKRRMLNGIGDRLS